MSETGTEGHVAELLAGLRLPGADQVGDPVGEHARLARAGAGQDEQGAFAVGHGGALGRVEPLQKSLDAVVGGGLGHDR